MRTAHLLRRNMELQCIYFLYDGAFSEDVQRSDGLGRRLC